MPVLEKTARITQKEIARQLGISQGIVSIVLRQAPMATRISDETKRRILELASRYDYPVTAGSFRPAKMSNMIGIIVKKEISQLSQDLVTLLNDELEKRNYRCVVSRLDLDGPDPELESFLEQIISYNYAGMICLGHFSPKLPELVPKTLEHYPNIVFLNTPHGIASAPCVRIDFGNGVAEAVRMLYQSGRRRIGLCLSDMVSDAGKGRFAGYCAGLLTSGLPMQPELCWVAEDARLCGWEGQDLSPIVEKIMTTWIANCAPDAVIASNDLWAVELIRALKTAGIRVPEDIAVVGYDNYDAYCRTCDPMLASISHNNEAITAALADIIDGLIEGAIDSASPLANREVKSFFIPRKSCGVESFSLPIS